MNLIYSVAEASKDAKYIKITEFTMQNNSTNKAIASLLKSASYSTKLSEQLQENVALEPWVQDKINKATDALASVYHYLGYETKFNEFTNVLKNPQLSEGQRVALENRLNEAKAKMKELKKAQAQKVDEEKSSTGGEITRTKTGLRHSHNPDRFSDEPHAEVASKVKSRSAAEKKGEKAMDKADEKESKAWGKANPGKQTIMKGGVKTTNEAKKDLPGKQEKIDADHDGKIEASDLATLRAKKKKMDEAKMTAGQKAHIHAVEYAKHHKAGNLEMAMHHKEACEESGGSISHAPNGNCMHSHPHVNHGAAYECYTAGAPTLTAPMQEAAKPDFLDMDKDGNKKEPMKKAVRDNDKKVKKTEHELGEAKKKAGKDYDGDGKVESPKDEVWGSRAKAAAKAGHPFKEAEEKTMSRAAKGMMKYGKEGMKALAKAGKEGKDLDKVRDKYDKYDESAKPSAGMSKGEKSSLVKKAKSGGDIGKPGKSFDKVAKAAGGGEKGKKIAAAAMWKNAAKESVETTAPVLAESAEVSRLKELTKHLLG